MKQEMSEISGKLKIVIREIREVRQFSKIFWKIKFLGFKEV